jgi:hypothetical protein
MSTHDLISTDHPLTQSERRALRRVAGLMIPASATLGVPGADDETIFAEILAAARTVPAPLRDALARLDAVAGTAFADLDANAQRDACERLRTGEPVHAWTFVQLVVPCYYRDDRVMRSLGMDARAPFPKGYDLEQGDWSLLDPVRARPRLYRDV